MADNPAPHRTHNLILDHTGFAADLAKRGVAFPLAGFAPGGYSVPCRTCARRFTGDKRASRCLSCAIKTAIATGSEAQDAARQDGERRGFRKAIDDLRDAADRRYGGQVKIDVAVVPGDGVKAGSA
ncbi:hypothetical protein LCGC14_0510730 [marine sediment metagenome]|uniref:Uncharacterized protein n=1 Tax=marine sediment metagenome TaxID=412755 RepID=A0A0F9UMU0_9ZZZZ